MGYNFTTFPYVEERFPYNEIGVKLFLKNINRNIEVYLGDLYI